ILALTGIEGKLYRPMATTVLLALSGAFVLSLTLVPALASYVIVPKANESETWILRQAHGAYVRLLPLAMKRRFGTISVALLTLVAGGTLLTRVGAEFVPQLDEGELVMEARRLPGIAL